MSGSAGSGGASGSGTGGAGTAGGGGAGVGGMGGAPVGPDPGTEGDGKITVTDMTRQPELTNQGNPVGREFSFKLTSQIYQFTEPTIAPGSPENQPRTVWVYVPKQYQDGTEAPLMVIQDGQQGSGTGGRYGSIKFALDNLTVSTDPARKIPAFIAIAVQDGGGDGPNNERGLEYDTISDRYARFVQNEVIPAVKADPNLKAAFPNFKLTDNPEGKATFGCSSGGAAALTMAWFRPDLFRRVVTYSGTFVAQQNTQLPEHAIYPDGAWDYHSDLNLIANTDMKPLRIFTNANQNDNGATQPESGKHNWLIANEKTHAALAAKGYHNRYVYGVGVGHCDDNLLRATLADALVWVWRGYPSN
jgi:enterochelin esterase-like enzyme